jgi:hypothetical protein
MAFTPSTIPWVSAVQQVADSAGASADGEMTTRAHNSLRSAVQYFSNRSKWNFLRGEGVPLSVIGPFSVAITASGGQASASALPGHGILADDMIVASGFLPAVRVTATAASGFGFSAVLTGFTAGLNSFSASFIRDSYAIPTDYKSGYTVRMLGSQKALRYVGRRLYDYGVTDETVAGTPVLYDLFNIYGRSKIRLLPPPSGADVLLQRYYRRMAVGSASGDTSTLDIPEDYESYPIAWAKWHFLTDKREQGGQQATTWLSMAQEGLKTMMADQTNIPDEGLMFLPGAASPYFTGGDRNTQYIDWET